MENTKGKYWTKIAIMAAIPAVLVGIIYLSTLLTPTIDLLDDTKDFKIDRQIDAGDGGNSECRLEKTAEGVDMIFTLRSSFAYPYVGMEIHKDDYSTFPIEDYVVEAIIESDEDMRFSVRLQEEFNFGDKGIAHPTAVYSFLLKKGNNEIEIPVEEIKDIPEWWYASYPHWTTDIQKMKYENIKIIWLTADNSNEKDVEHRVKVKSLRLVPVACKDFLSDVITVMLAFWAILAIVALYLRRNNISEEEKEKGKEQQVVYVPYEKLDTEKDTINLKDEILTFIGKNYPNPELKLADVAKALSMAEDRTSEEIRIATGKSFKAYLNTIRIEESKRLLKNTAMHISEIAFSVGYNNVQHFNRVFKESVGVAPGTFRDGSTNNEGAEV
ncbi:MAG: helix-turn-helix transcriptional regulator [Paludibacteraceae bacterium]|nr:helix-turn-helix transcriptional regulator [Paludibacteraceae bacterium]